MLHPPLQRRHEVKIGIVVVEHALLQSSKLAASDLFCKRGFVGLDDIAKVFANSAYAKDISRRQALDYVELQFSGKQEKSTLHFERLLYK